MSFHDGSDGSRCSAAGITPPRAAALVEALRAGPLLCDGAMGTMLEKSAAALPPPLHPTVLEELNILAPDAVHAIHQAYAAAGARVLQTNSFGASAVKLEAVGLRHQAWALNERAAQLARAAAESAPHDVWVAGSIGPTGALLEPLGELTFTAARETFAAQAAALLAGGADLLIIETMTDLTEALAALMGARQSATVPVVVTLTFEPHGRTMMGVTPEGAARALQDWGADMVGANCGYGPDVMLPILRRLHEAVPDLPLAAQANAGLPALKNGLLSYDVEPEAFAAFVPAFLDAGVRLLGSCCGSTPQHTRALAAALSAAAKADARLLPSGR